MNTWISKKHSVLRTLVDDNQVRLGGEGRLVLMRHTRRADVGFVGVCWSRRLWSGAVRL
jgi:hypothetical protein